MFVTRVSEELLPKYGAVVTAMMKNDAPGRATAERELAEALPAWDRALAGRTFAVGNTFTLADIILYTPFPAAASFVGFKPPSNLAHLAAWLERMAARPSAAVLQAP